MASGSRLYSLPQANFLLDNRRWSVIDRRGQVHGNNLFSICLQYYCRQLNDLCGRSLASSRASYKGDNNGQLDRYSSQGEEKTSHHHIIYSFQRKMIWIRMVVMYLILCLDPFSTCQKLDILLTTYNFEELLSQMRSIQAAGGAKT